MILAFRIWKADLIKIDAIKLTRYIANITSCGKLFLQTFCWCSSDALSKSDQQRDRTALPSGDWQTFRKAENSHVHWISRVPFFFNAFPALSAENTKSEDDFQAAKLCEAAFACQIWSPFFSGGAPVCPCLLDEVYKSLALTQHRKFFNHILPVWNVCHFHIHDNMHCVALLLETKRWKPCSTANHGTGTRCASRLYSIIRQTS